MSTNVVFISERSLECFHHRINSAGTRNCTNSSLCSGLFFTRLQPSVDVEYFNIEAVSEIQVSEIQPHERKQVAAHRWYSETFWHVSLISHQVVQNAGKHNAKTRCRPNHKKRMPVAIVQKVNKDFVCGKANGESLAIQSTGQMFFRCSNVGFKSNPFSATQSSLSYVSR